MTALAVDRDTAQIDTTVIPETASIPVAANTIIYAGSLVFTDAAGRAVPGAATVTLVAAGVAQKQAPNRTTDPSGGAAGAINVNIKRCAAPFDMGAGADAFTIANRNAACYASDDHTVNLTDGAGTRPFAGTVIDVVGTQAIVVVGLPGASAGGGAAGGLQAGMQPTHAVRGVTTANVAALATFTVANDGITLVAGDRVLLPFQTTGSQNGIYVVGTVGGGTAPLTRATDFDDTSIGEAAPTVVVGVAEGTYGAGKMFELTTANPITIGTTALAFQQIVALLPTAVGQVLQSTILGTATVPGEMAYAAVNLGVAASITGKLPYVSQTTLEVRGVIPTNVASLAAFVVAGFEGLTYGAGDILLLAGQTVSAQNGVYLVGTVAGTAPLTRIAQLPAGAVVTGGFTVHVNEGTLFKNTNWFISTAGPITIGTTSHAWFPETVTASVVLIAGTLAAITTIPLLAATSQIVYTRTTANTCTATISYQTVPAPTPGASGAASIVPMATVGAGTLNNADISTLLMTVINR